MFYIEQILLTSAFFHHFVQLFLFILNCFDDIFLDFFRGLSVFFQDILVYCRRCGFQIIACQIVWFSKGRTIYIWVVYPCIVITTEIFLYFPGLGFDLDFLFFRLGEFALVYSLWQCRFHF